MTSAGVRRVKYWLLSFKMKEFWAEDVRERVMVVEWVLVETPFI